LIAPGHLASFVSAKVIVGIVKDRMRKVGIEIGEEVKIKLSTLSRKL
jgi:hypothetical protein